MTVAEAKDTIITAAHVFSDDDGVERTPYSECYVTNYAHPNIRYPISIEPGDFKLGYTIKSPRDILNDYAVIRLKKPIAEATPYLADRSGIPVSKGDRQFVITPTFGFNKIGKHPKFQTATVTRAFNPDSKNRNAYLSDADTNHGDSGGIYLRRSTDQNQGLRIKGINQGGVAGSKDYCAYDDSKCSTLSVELSGPFLKTLMDMAHRKPTQPDPVETLRL